MAADGESRPMMDLKIKTTTTTYDVSVPENATVGELKTALTTVCNEPVEKLCLIFSGKILQNDDKLESHGVKNGMSVHLVLRNSTSANRPAAAAQSSATPNASATSGTQRTNTGNTARPTGTSNIFANLMSGAQTRWPNK
uniref:Ubiquitin-like domain-containing protein n=1 Tax=Steinernema glaseri TaxID=37863 RepID=A0A1I7YZW8_9BILA